MEYKDLESLKDFYNNLVENNKSFILFSNNSLIDNASLSNFYYSIDVLPGSFNPIHEQHKRIYSELGRPFYELSIFRRSKEDLDLESLHLRLKQFQNSNVIITRACFFYEKADILKQISQKVNFYIGFDTAQRLLQDHDFKFIESIPCEFWIVPRIIDGKKKSFYDLGKNLPFNFSESFIAPSSISSTEIRENKNARTD